MTFEFKEQLVIAEIYECINNINIVTERFKIEKNEPIKLFESFSNNYWTKQYDNQIYQQLKAENKLTAVTRGNHFAYFNTVLNNFNQFSESKKILTSLNESDNNLSGYEFMKSLENVINQLSKINDVDKIKKLPDLVMQTKIFSKEPINIYGINIMDMLGLEVLDFIAENKIIFVFYDNSNKQLIFVPYVDNSNETQKNFLKAIYVYDLKFNYFGEYNDFLKKYKGVTPANNLLSQQRMIDYNRKIDHNNISAFMRNELYLNPIRIMDNTNYLNIQMTDNIYNNKKRFENFVKNFSKYNNSAYTFVK